MNGFIIAICVSVSHRLQANSFSTSSGHLWQAYLVSFRIPTTIQAILQWSQLGGWQEGGGHRDGRGADAQTEAQGGKGQTLLLLLLRGGAGGGVEAWGLWGGGKQRVGAQKNKG